jgi:hypothetical protein
VDTELKANQSDNSRWLYYDVDRKPEKSVTQWVAETTNGDLHRVLDENGQKLSAGDQQKKMDGLVKNLDAQSKQRKSERHDDEQATELLKLLPQAFLWKSSGKQAGVDAFHFKPDPKFHPPNREAKVFSAMEGDMAVDAGQHRIVSLKGKLIRDVKFGGGILGNLHAGGSFDVERREIGKGLWQITETHVHIQGRALLFKSISEEEDEEKSKFERLPDTISLQEAERRLLQEGIEQSK